MIVDSGTPHPSKTKFPSKRVSLAIPLAMFVVAPLISDLNYIIPKAPFFDVVVVVVNLHDPNNFKISIQRKSALFSWQLYLPSNLFSSSHGLYDKLLLPCHMQPLSTVDISQDSRLCATDKVCLSCGETPLLV